MKLLEHRFALSGMLMLLVASSVHAQPASWQAGAAAVDITSSTPMWLAGDAFRDHASEGTIHPLWVKALALQGGQGHRAVIVTSDVFDFSNDLMSYIPSLRVLLEGGYEGDTSQLEYGMPAKWAEDVETRILDTVRALAGDIGIAVKPLE